ncbi:MAG: hypothetical protein KC414_14295 [Romboutsia sp.]|nr:hypothetical protein [Romboutsia sp.]
MDLDSVLKGEKWALDRERRCEIPFNISLETRQKLKNMGFVIDKISNNLTTLCKFPSGWTASISKDSRHIYMLDETGKKRVYMFVKHTVFGRHVILNTLE